jgi:Asp/Glu/hydantoin racemase
MMRIWHQSYTDLSSLPIYRERLRSHSHGQVESGTQVTINGMPKGLPGYVQPNPYVELLRNVEVCEAAQLAEREGYDVVVLGCIYDPGLEEARSVTSTPVLGLAETVLNWDHGLRRGLGFVSLNQADDQRLRDLVTAYGCESEVCCTTHLDPASAESDYETRHPRRVRELLDRFELVAARCIDAGAKAIVPAEGALNEFLVESGCSVIRGVPVLDCIGILWARAESVNKAPMTGSRGLSSVQKTRCYVEESRGARQFLLDHWTGEGRSLRRTHPMESTSSGGNRGSDGSC